jgi:hypothetical protein
MPCPRPSSSMLLGSSCGDEPSFSPARGYRWSWPLGVVSGELAGRAGAGDSPVHVYRRLVETCTDAALETKNRGDACQAQSRMLELFRQCNVVQPVIDAIDYKINKMK